MSEVPHKDSIERRNTRCSPRELEGGRNRRSGVDLAGAFVVRPSYLCPGQQWSSMVL